MIRIYKNSIFEKNENSDILLQFKNVEISIPLQCVSVFRELISRNCNISIAFILMLLL